VKYTTGHMSQNDVNAVEFMIKEFQRQDPNVTRQTFITWCVKHTVHNLFRQVEEATAKAREDANLREKDAQDEGEIHIPSLSHISLDPSEGPSLS